MYTNNKLNGGLNGAFGRWLKKNLVSIATTVAIAVGGPAAGAVVQLFAAKINDYAAENFTGTWWSRSSLPFSDGGLTPFEPTAKEEVILDNWVNNKFLLYFKNFVTALDTAMLSNSVSVINLQLAKMCIIREYYLVNETEGLSQNAVNIRMELINELFKPIDELIKAKLGNATISNVTANQNDFNGLFSLSVQGEVYSCGQYAVSQIQQQLVVAPIRTITPGTLPTSTPVAPVTQFTTLVPTSPGTKEQLYQSVIVPLDPQEGTVTISKKGGWNWLATLSAASVLLTAYSIFKKDKPKN